MPKEEKVKNVLENVLKAIFVRSPMSLRHSERLHVTGCALTCSLVHMLSLGTGCHTEPIPDRRTSNNLMQSIVKRVASGLVIAMRNKTAKEADKQCASGKCAASLPLLQKAIILGHLPSRALMAHLLIDGREGVAKDCNAAFELVEEGARLGCHHCQGVLAWCYWGGHGIRRDAARSLELARESSGKGSKYGQYLLSWFYRSGAGGVARDYTEALSLLQLAAAQNFDGAQHSLGWMCANGSGVARNHAKALRFYQLAVAQGHPEALFRVANCYEQGRGVPANKAEAIRWYRRALAAGYSYAKHSLQMLGVKK
jgi:TPR repeat protein